MPSERRIKLRRGKKNCHTWKQVDASWRNMRRVSAFVWPKFHCVWNKSKKPKCVSVTRFANDRSILHAPNNYYQLLLRKKRHLSLLPIIILAYKDYCTFVNQTLRDVKLSWQKLCDVVFFINLQKCMSINLYNLFVFVKRFGVVLRDCSLLILHYVVFFFLINFSYRESTGTVIDKHLRKWKEQIGFSRWQFFKSRGRDKPVLATWQFLS